MCCSPTWVQRPLCSARTHPALLFFHSFYKSVVNTLFCRTDDACARRVASLVPLNKKMAAAAEATLCCEREKERETDKRKRERKKEREANRQNLFFSTLGRRRSDHVGFSSLLFLSPFLAGIDRNKFDLVAVAVPVFSGRKKTFESFPLVRLQTQNEIFYFCFSSLLSLSFRATSAEAI